MIHRTELGEALRLGINWTRDKDYEKKLLLRIMIPYWLHKGIIFDPETGLIKKGWSFKVIVFKMRFSYCALE